MLDLLKNLFRDTPEHQGMTTVVYKTRVIAADGHATLEFKKDHQVFVPRVDDTIYVTTCTRRPEEIVADVVEVVVDPINNLVTCIASTDLDLANGYTIGCLIENAVNDGWAVASPIDYHCGSGCPCREDCKRQPGCDAAGCGGGACPKV